MLTLMHKKIFQNAVNVMHIKGSLLEQEVILLIASLFHNGNFSLRKEFAPTGSFF